jgi:WXXGXW repeat (2 copies)
MHKVRLFLCSGMIALAVLAVSISSHAQIAVGVAIHVGPPALPAYTQPIGPGPGYVWTPGYWAYGDEGYYWVPGTWVVAPVGMLWTPGYWGWSEGVYAWHAGYWGPHVGFYGGINYGFGYTGVGYAGGYWRGHDFFYNRTVNNINAVSVHNTFEKTVIVNHTTINNVSFNGGPGGINARATAAEAAAAREHHVEATKEQMDHEHAARNNRNQLASVNHGRPAFGATSKAGEFNGHGSTNAARFNSPHSAPSGGATADHGRPDYSNPGHENGHGGASREDSQPSHQAHVESTPHSSGGGSGRGEQGGSHGSEHGEERHEGRNHER